MVGMWNGKLRRAYLNPVNRRDFYREGNIAVRNRLAVHMESRSEGEFNGQPQPLEPTVGVRVQRRSYRDFLILCSCFSLGQRTLPPKAVFKERHPCFSFPIALLEPLLQHPPLFIEEERARVRTPQNMSRFGIP